MAKFRCTLVLCIKKFGTMMKNNLIALMNVTFLDINNLLPVSKQLITVKNGRIL
ncbi:MAG: hypothetical protein ACLSSW_02765 [Acutalibacteraceae bacterium]